MTPCVLTVIVMWTMLCLHTDARVRLTQLTIGALNTVQTIGASFAMKKVEASGRPCNLGIWVRALRTPRSSADALALALQRACLA